MRFCFSSLLLSILIATLSCGGGGTAVAPPAGPLSGNWQVALVRHADPTDVQTFTGFMLQSGSSVSGSLIFFPAPNTNPGCYGVGPISGKVDGQNVSLTINEFGQDVSLTGTLPSASQSLGGAFSSLAGGCAAFPNTGTWSAMQIAPLNSSFHGTFTSQTTPVSNGTLQVSGTLTQGPNTGGSNATLTGSLTVNGPARFCSYLSTATIRGLISGTTVQLGLYGPDGSLITQIGQLNNALQTPLTITPDGTSMTGTYIFPPITASAPCNATDQGTVALTFP